MFMKQTEYLKGVLRYYHENDIIQGDPEEGVWDLAHTPLPRGLGNDTLLLLHQHHVIHDILQSWELNSQYFYAGRVAKVLYGSGVFAKDWFLLCDVFETINKAHLTAIGKGTCVSNGKMAKDLKLGIFDPKHLGKGGKVGGKVGMKTTNSQRWECLVTGEIKPPGPLSLYQKARGIDTKLRKRVYHA
jgi:hypothetical protein